MSLKNQRYSEYELLTIIHSYKKYHTVLGTNVAMEKAIETMQEEHPEMGLRDVPSYAQKVTKLVRDNELDSTYALLLEAIKKEEKQASVEVFDQSYTDEVAPKKLDVNEMGVSVVGLANGKVRICIEMSSLEFAEFMSNSLKLRLKS